MPSCCNSSPRQGCLQRKTLATNGSNIRWQSNHRATYHIARKGSLTGHVAGPEVAPDPTQAFAERRGITFRERVAEIVRKIERGLEKWAPVFHQDTRPAKTPEKVRGIFDGVRLPSARADVPEPAVPERKVAEDPGAELRRARTRALIRHARAVDDIFTAHDAGGKGSPEQLRELGAARKAFEEVRPYGPADAEAAYIKNPELAREAGSGQTRRAVQAPQLETELRTDPQRRAVRFVARWQELSSLLLQPCYVRSGAKFRGETAYPVNTAR
jgi:hypothetical protein